VTAGLRATRAYLAARPVGEVDWAAAPPTYKRYPAEGRLVLPWDGGSDPLSSVLRDLMGLRPRWSYPVALTGTARPERPVVDVGRPVPSGGGLHPVELYVGIGPGAGRAAGLYHYDPAHHCLDLLRPGDHRAALSGLLDASPAVLPDLLIVCTAVFWRNGFKYRDFAYNLQCQETGALAAQFLALSESLGERATVHLTFHDREVNRLLGIDAATEGALALLTLGSDTAARIEELPAVTDLSVTPAAAALEPVPAITSALPHLARLHTAAARPVRVSDHVPRFREAADGEPLPAARPVQLADGIPARASALVGYRRDPVDAEVLAAVLRHAAPGYPGDLKGAREAPVAVDLHVLVDRVRGLAPGAYRYDATTHALVQVGDASAMAVVRGGPVHENTGIGLAAAAAAVVPVGDPLDADRGLGDRWYRIQQIETGLVVHRAALAAAVCGLGARIHSDGANRTTDAALGLRGTERSLSFLLLGHERRGPRLPGPSLHRKELP
jgi:SagB-type dehydrogenase family enzyme